MNRTRVCLECNHEFTYEIGLGKDRHVCSLECRKERKHKLAKARVKHYKECKVEGCKGKANRIKFGLCESCYYRLRRTGTTKKKIAKYKYITKAGYIKVKLPDHPLAEKGGNIFEHRQVFYDNNKDKPLICFWCEETLTWKNVKIDHLNNNKSDNQPSNLVASCNDCNRARGAMIPFLKRLKTNAFDTFVATCKI
jgi:hypothetical protein